MNKTVIIGRLTKDIDFRYTPTGTAYGRFTLAVNRRFTNQNGVREADFIPCQVWNKPAENMANYTKKGSLIAVEGRMQSSTYDDKDGNKRFSLDLVVESVEFLETKNKNNDTPTNNVPSDNFGDFENFNDDDLPFD